MGVAFDALASMRAGLISMSCVLVLFESACRRNSSGFVPDPPLVNRSSAWRFHPHVHGYFVVDDMLRMFLGIDEMQ